MVAFGKCLPVATALNSVGELLSTCLTTMISPIFTLPDALPTDALVRSISPLWPFAVLSPSMPGIERKILLFTPPVNERTLWGARAPCGPWLPCGPVGPAGPTGPARPRWFHVICVSLLSPQHSFEERVVPDKLGSITRSAPKLAPAV